MFKNAIVRKPGQSIVHGLSSGDLGLPIYKKALLQHKKYIEALKTCGLKVQVLDADNFFPDSTFVEDVSLCTPHCAIITNSSAPSRKGESACMQDILNQYYDNIEIIKTPGTLDAGDVMMVENHFYIGLSNRTNIIGARQLIGILKKFGMTGVTVPLKEVLHLKTGVSYLENNTLLVSGEFVCSNHFESFNKIIVNDNEKYAANSLWINGTVLVPKNHPDTILKIKNAGYTVVELDMSEFQKIDGGLSCLSLRF
ncbi:MAG: arginine deiminase family protein [Saprospiraceae bacterium]|nr:arginine deiminase family protein [Saprospiraceae bacterium]